MYTRLSYRISKNAFVNISSIPDTSGEFPTAQRRKKLCVYKPGSNQHPCISYYGDKMLSGLALTPPLPDVRYSFWVLKQGLITSLISLQQLIFFFLSLIQFRDFSARSIKTFIRVSLSFCYQRKSIVSTR